MDDFKHGIYLMFLVPYSFKTNAHLYLYLYSNVMLNEKAVFAM